MTMNSRLAGLARAEKNRRRRAEILRLARDGVIDAEIARQVGVHQYAVDRVLRTLRLTGELTGGDRRARRTDHFAAQLRAAVREGNAVGFVARSLYRPA